MKEYKKDAENKKTKIMKITLIILIITTITTILLIKPDKNITLIAYLTILFSTIMIYSSKALRIIEKIALIKKIKTEELTEGDWVINSLNKKNNKKMKINKTGITKEEIEKLKKLGIKKVIIKQGIPFVPSFLIGYVALLINNYYM